MPLYVIHSRADQTVPVAPLEQAVGVLKGRGGNVTLVLIDEIPHSMIPGFVEPLAAAVPWIRQVWGA